MAHGPPPFVSSEVETPLRAKPRRKAGAEALLRGRRRLLGGPDAPERLREADAENEMRARNSNLLATVAVVAILALAAAAFWSENLADLWNLAWFLPLVLFGGLIYHGLDELGGALCRRAAKPFRTHSYDRTYYFDEEDEAPDYSMAEIPVDDEHRP